MRPSLLSVEDATARVLELAARMPVEQAPIQDAIGRAIALEVRAARPLPPWDNSAMDGYAVRAGDVDRAPARLRVVETIHAGQAPVRAVGPGECARIMTGARVPEGADAVVMQEVTRPDAEHVEVLEPVRPGSHIRRRGEDVADGEVLFAPGQA